MVERYQLAPGYTMSRLLKGGWHLAGGHGEVDRRQAIDDMAAFVEAGITSFDCADHYTGVEELIGDFRAAYPELGRRIEIHTKFVPDYDRLTSCDRAYVESIIDRSLTRLRTDCLDLVQFHWWNYAVPGYVEAMGVLDDLRRAGKIRLLGLTNFNTATTREIVEAGVPVAATQVQYSVLDSRPERGLVELCRAHGIGLLCYGSLAGGFLSEAWLGQPEPQEPLENRSLTKYKLIIEDFGGWALFQQLLGVLQRIGERHGVGIGPVATRYVLDRPGVAGAIVGATSTRHLAANLRVDTLRLDGEDAVALQAVLAKRQGPPGDCYDIERDKTGRHGRIMRYNQNDGRH
ncbi:MAG: aldo/keto reductase [Ferrovibrio sp.]|uniref:aldo/keto reductase n=1 Tax=Ferrovibrio sp. TaxID=1917215 RepID=UPI00262583CF|nr:aldo/keto reductase [Ferrovibrio sp.]MCW0235732.1 aldo/keto reductase [Ferrovibrio sp.]